MQSAIDHKQRAQISSATSGAIFRQAATLVQATTAQMSLSQVPTSSYHTMQGHVVYRESIWGTVVGWNAGETGAARFRRKQKPPQLAFPIKANLRTQALGAPSPQAFKPSASYTLRQAHFYPT